MIEDYYPATYSDGRGRFLSACLDAGLSVASYRNPHSGPQGEALFADATLVGRADAENVVVVTSSTHGVEGFAGSGIQVGLLRDPRAPRPLPDTALLLIHTINPYGMAWLRRENEDNVDLNRNFVDHEGGNYPENDSVRRTRRAPGAEGLERRGIREVQGRDQSAQRQVRRGPGAQGDAQGPVPPPRQRPLRRERGHLVESHPGAHLQRVSRHRATWCHDRRPHRSRSIWLR